jgi:glycosyltransferase involved in cell wall biosynthesis
MEIDVVIPIRDREKQRILNCIENCKWAKRIIIVDYGSKEPFEIEGAEVFRFPRFRQHGNENFRFRIWNKAHALNIGIKMTTADYVACLDVDTILPPNFHEKVLANLSPNNFIFVNNVLRIDNYEGYEKSLPTGKPWHEGKPEYQGAVGGIQIMPREWLFKVRGYDEELVYWGGMDTWMLERAKLDLNIVRLDVTVLHQEHEKIKEDQLEDENERARAKEIRLNRTPIIFHKIKALKEHLPMTPKYNVTWGETHEKA